jgi:uncharacterized protein
LSPLPEPRHSLLFFQPISHHKHGPMRIQLGHIQEVVRYPIKSMAGVPTAAAFLGWHGLAGDRRLAFRRLDDRGGFPWLAASKLPELILHQPLGVDELAGEPLPTHVRTPDGQILGIWSAELSQRVSGALGSLVDLMQLKHGIFDDASVSVIALPTMGAICRAAGQPLDSRRFRANLVVNSTAGESFLEDGWVGGTLVFGDPDSGPMVHVTQRDLRCMMINLDPDTAKQNAGVMKAAVRLNQNNAGAYGTVVRTGELRVGDTVALVV